MAYRSFHLILTTGIQKAVRLPKFSPSHKMAYSTAPSLNSDNNDVIFTEMKSTGIITMNRTKALNALNLSMIRKIYPSLQKWDKNPEISHVIIEGVGDRAFCAGGDVVAITESARQDESPLYKDFFREEYQLNYLTGTLSKPYIALIDGITMGGGVGLSVHGPYRVATERTLFAMPETAIGLFPDVGGGHFLPRLPGELGVFLALTGFRLKGEDVVKSGVATHFVDSNKITDLKETLIGVSMATTEEIERVLKNFQEASACNPTSPFVLESHMAEIKEHFHFDTVEEIMASLGKASSEWAKKQLTIMEKMSPTSMKVTLRQMREAAKLGLADCLRMEYRLSQRSVEDHDFCEGVRALLVDKDSAPKWKPSTLEGVTSEKLDWYFSHLPAEREWTVTPDSKL